MKKVKKTKKVVVSKPANKSLMGMIVAGVVLLGVGLYAYGYYLNSSQWFAETYVEEMTPEEVTINLVTAGRKLPMSDDPSVNAMVAANQVYQQPKKDKTEAQIEKEARIAAEQAARATIVTLNNTAGTNIPQVPTIAIKAEVEKSANDAITTLNNYVVYKPDENGVLKPVNRKAYDLVGSQSTGEPLCDRGGQYAPVGTTWKEGNSCFRCVLFTKSGSRAARKVYDKGCTYFNRNPYKEVGLGADTCVVHKSKDGNSFSMTPSNYFNKPVQVPAVGYLKVIDENGDKKMWKCDNGHVGSFEY